MVAEGARSRCLARERSLDPGEHLPNPRYGLPMFQCSSLPSPSLSICSVLDEFVSLAPNLRKERAKKGCEVSSGEFRAK